MTKRKPKKDHPEQTIDGDVPDGETVNEEAFKALQDNFEGSPEDLEEVVDDDYEEESEITS